MTRAPAPASIRAGLEADPAVAAGDHHVPPGLVGDVVGGPVRSGHAAQPSRALQPPLALDLSDLVEPWLNQVLTRRGWCGVMKGRRRPVGGVLR